MNTIHVSGNLDAASVPARLRESAPWFDGGDALTIDLTAIDRADSAGVALLLQWLRQARAAQNRLTFSNAPQQMRALIAFYELGNVIPLAAADTPAT